MVSLPVLRIGSRQHQKEDDFLLIAPPHKLAAPGFFDHLLAHDCQRIQIARLEFDLPQLQFAQQLIESLLFVLLGALYLPSGYFCDGLRSLARQDSEALAGAANVRGGASVYGLLP